MRDNEKNIHKMGAILQAKKAPEGEVKGAYENSGFSSDRCAAEVMKCDEKKGLTESDVIRALYHMYCAAAYKGNVTMSSETAIGLYNFFNSQKAEIERLQNGIEELNNKLDMENDSRDEYFKNCDAYADKCKRRYGELYEEAKEILKAEAIKEFAERLTFKLVNTPFGVNSTGETDEFKNGVLHGLVAKQNNVIDVIDNLVKETVGDV